MNLRNDPQRLVVIKKSRLNGCILRVAKVAEANANQAKPLLWVEADAFAERKRDIRKLLA